MYIEWITQEGALVKKEVSDTMNMECTTPKQERKSGSVASPDTDCSNDQRGYLGCRTSVRDKWDCWCFRSRMADVRMRQGRG